MPISPDIREHLAEIAQRLDAAQHGGTGAIVDDACRYYGWSLSKLYRRLRDDVGWNSGRKVRADKGATLVAVDNLDVLSAMKREGVRLNGKRTMATTTGASVMVVNGYDLPVSNSRLNALMRARKMNLDALSLADAPIHMRSLYPNHVHQVDPSLCVLYYLGGKQNIMEADKFYKNKLENYARVKLKVWRYVLYDHASALLAVRYYEAAGENPTILFDFLTWCWGKQPDREFHGVPALMVWDKGSANTAHAIKNLLASLEVKPIEHAPGKARVKGGVEKGNDIVECKFESRLKLEPVSTVEQLNASALAWQNAFNADLIVREDNRLRRRGMEPVARYHLWRRILAAQLRLLPDIAICRSLLEGKEAERKVRGLEITFRHPAATATRSYKVDGLAGVCDGDTVLVRPLLIGGDCAINVRVARYDGEDQVYRLEAEPAPDEYGFPAHAATWGVEYKATRDTEADKAAKRLDALAYPDQDADAARAKQAAPFGGALNAHSHLADIQLPSALPRRGTELNVPMRAQVEIKPLSHFQAAQAIKPRIEAMGLAWSMDHYQRLVAGWPEGVMEQDLDSVATTLSGQDTHQRHGLRLVS